MSVLFNVLQSQTDDGLKHDASTEAREEDVVKPPVRKKNTKNIVSTIVFFIELVWTWTTDQIKIWINSISMNSGRFPK